MKNTIELYDKGIKTFGNVELFEKWLNRPNPGLGDKAPKDLINTVEGVKIVEDLLINIQYGNLGL